MKIIRIAYRGIRNAFISVFRNFSLSLASISCISITLIVVALALLVAFNVENFSTKAGDNVTIVTYLTLGATDEEIEEFETKLKGMDNIVQDWKKQTPEERKNLAKSYLYWLKEYGTDLEKEDIVESNGEIFILCAEKEYDYAVKQKKPVIALIHENINQLPREKTERRQPSQAVMRALTRN